MSDTNQATEATTEAVETPEAEAAGSDFFNEGPSDATLALLNAEAAPGDEIIEQRTEEVEEEVTEEAKGEGTESLEELKAKQKEPEVKDDARFSKEFTRLSNKEKDLVIREKQLKDASAQLDNLNASAQNFNTQPIDFIKAQLSAFAGTDDQDTVDGAFRDLYEAMTMHVLGADAPEEMKKQSQYNKLQRDFEQYKLQQQAEKTELEQSALESQRTVKVTQAQAKIKTQLSEAKEQFPYLLTQTDEDPGELVFEIVWEDYNTRLKAGEADATPMSIEEAAVKANTHYEQLAQKWAKLIPSAPATATPTTGQPATNRPGNSRTLTNSNASVAPTVEGSNYIDDDEESKLKAMELLFS